MTAVDPFVGRDLLDGRFKIIGKVGSGGMSAVYTALQTDMNRHVAVKILHPKLSARKDLVARLRREARAMSQISHPNVTNVFLFGELDDGSIYVVMELLEGRNLRKALATEGPLRVDKAVHIIIGVCGALQEAHSLGIIHRDLKPENIFLVTAAGIRDFPKVLDFGLAKVSERQMHPGSIKITQVGQVFGTPEYMSPEQAQGKKLTPASDIYSLGLVLYEALTGELPFESKDAVGYILKHVNEMPISINERVTGRTFSPIVTKIIDKTLAKDPADRFASAAELADALRASLGGHALPAPHARNRTKLVLALVLAFVVGVALTAAVMTAVLR
jgi:serine/threonine-protein kinase